MKRNTLIMTTLLATSTANAAVLNDVQLDGLLTGNTLYLNIPAGGPALPDGGIVPFKYGSDGSSSARLSPSLTLLGTWTIRSDHYCVDWENGPKNSCTKIEKTPSGMNLIDKASGEIRGTVDRIVPGNPENI